MENVETIYFIIGFGILVVMIGIMMFFVLKNINKKDDSGEEKLLIRDNERLRSSIDQNIAEKATIENELKNLKKDKHGLDGENKMLIKELTESKTRLETAREKFIEQQQNLAKFEAEKERKQKEFETQSKQLENARKSLEEERIRIQREDEEEQQKILAERSRKWNDHENEVVYLLKDVCKKPELNFSFYDNTNLPVEFDGRLKPDFMVEFLGQYIIFDAKKSSKLENIKTYIADQVKKSAEKYAKNELINSQVFFIVPQEAIETMNKLYFFERGFRFFIISKESVEPILFNFKRITEYENIEKIDPQERENIVDLIANYDRHVSFQNAANIILARESIELMNSKKKLGEELQSEISIKKQNIREKKLTPNEIKRISMTIENQEKEIDELTSTKSLIEEKEIKSAKKSLNI